MSNNQPSSASAADAPQMKDDLTAAAVLHDDSAGQPANAVMAGAAAPNSPVDAHLPRDAANGLAASEARQQAVSSNPPEPNHSSR